MHTILQGVLLLQGLGDCFQKEQCVNLSVQKYYIIISCEDFNKFKINFITVTLWKKAINRRWYKERLAFKKKKKKFMPD